MNFFHWKDGDFRLGYLMDYPNYTTQGESLEDLLEHLKDLNTKFEGGLVQSN